MYAIKEWDNKQPGFTDGKGFVLLWLIEQLDLFNIFIFMFDLFFPSM
jgi:hypothetical protein